MIITVVVGKKPDDVMIPDVIGKSQDNAISAIRSTGKLSVTIREIKVFETARNVVVKGTSPAPQTMFAPDTTVMVYIGRLVDQTPNIVGLTEEDAKRTLLTAGFSPTIMYTSTGAAGKAVNQKPKAGASTYRTAYAIEITGKNFDNGITRKEKSSVA